jgi:hypothetical protein
MLSYEDLLSVLLSRVAGYRHDLVALLGFCHDIFLHLISAAGRFSWPAAAINGRRVLTPTGEVAEATLTLCSTTRNKDSNSGLAGVAPRPGEQQAATVAAFVTGDWAFSISARRLKW